jgi:hypothetical protein
VDQGLPGNGSGFLTASTFSLAKTIRDQHAADKLIHKINEVRTHKILQEFDPEAPTA